MSFEWLELVPFAILFYVAYVFERRLNEIEKRLIILEGNSQAMKGDISYLLQRSANRTE
jgi:hypothetical protein